ncbi:hypothetical protein G7067_11625 [Leucobacter insecticola]|uniref:Uncharacterized protein n=1 Tax=Leucobacter insecticola TaxID=2714934 RepID=A0A6G8FLE4_9MICO|nr:hypothetical protein [Leucobacter insecticola]QIM16902.1 hypothetical protein G7067_11625 [Leucobacter insecticola]
MEATVQIDDTEGFYADVEDVSSVVIEDLLDDALADPQGQSVSIELRADPQRGVYIRVATEADAAFVQARFPSDSVRDDLTEAVTEVGGELAVSPGAVTVTMPWNLEQSGDKL